MNKCRWMVASLRDADAGSADTLRRFGNALDSAMGRTEKAATVAIVVTNDSIGGFYVKTAIGRLPGQDIDIESIRVKVRNAANRVADGMRAELVAAIRKVGQMMAVPLLGGDEGKVGAALEIMKATATGR